jgi:hypothetical protein
MPRSSVSRPTSSVLDGAELVCVYLGDNTEKAEGTATGPSMFLSRVW